MKFMVLIGLCRAYRVCRVSGTGSQDRIICGYTGSLSNVYIGTTGFRVHQPEQLERSRMPRKIQTQMEPSTMQGLV